MTVNKRFKGGQGKVSDVGEDLIFKLLCLIAEENQELRTKNNTYIQDIETYREENTHLKLENEELKNNMKIKLCNNCIYWRLGTAGLNDNYCSLTDEWADWEGTCEKWKGYHD